MYALLCILVPHGHRKLGESIEGGGRQIFIIIMFNVFAIVQVGCITWESVSIVM